jgi:hypothetical protein
MVLRQFARYHTSPQNNVHVRQYLAVRVCDVKVYTQKLLYAKDEGDPDGGLQFRVWIQHGARGY